MKVKQAKQPVTSIACTKAAIEPPCRLTWCYWQSGRGYDVQLAADDEHDSATIHDTHWTLSDYINAIIEVGGTIKRIDERPVKYEDDQPAGPPAFLLIHVKSSST